ncbi:mechanosensitive ion channel family protein [Alicyclobacillus fastidiosus]|uniref:Mechanosensitive ion channel family protein n=1 Tax=Alicyclobacillus fastidiosus TaxID=392011 RepID=A0ABV5AM00_9BACL|nr:mechanosensitive ion channel family protein [Alicyclobacillus fastidiosus]WEH08321.1 mechanosensitive ion channel family protein [Alicyclobacillus fastidiosus]
MSPWRRIGLVAVILILLSITFNLAHDLALKQYVPAQYFRLVEWGLVLVWCFIGYALVRNLNHFILSKTLRKHIDTRTARLLSRVLTAIGFVFIVLVALNLLQIRLSSLLVGGAVTGVIVGIGAQSTLSNLFAGLILLTLRPFSVGQYITLRTSLFSGIEYGGTVFDVNWYYTILIDGDQKRVLPNSSVIVSAVTINAAEKPADHVFTVPVSYSVSEKVLGDELSQLTNGQAKIKIREFSKDAYVVEIHLPASQSPGIIREILAKYQA